MRWDISGGMPKVGIVLRSTAIPSIGSAGGQTGFARQCFQRDIQSENGRNVGVWLAEGGARQRYGKCRNICIVGSRSRPTGALSEHQGRIKKWRYIQSRYK
jgi:hypothetical protein